jgi:hypothetical protein
MELTFNFENCNYSLNMNLKVIGVSSLLLLSSLAYAGKGYEAPEVKEIKKIGQRIDKKYKHALKGMSVITRNKVAECNQDWDDMLVYIKGIENKSDEYVKGTKDREHFASVLYEDFNALDQRNNDRARFCTLSDKSDGCPILNSKLIVSICK